MDEKNEGFANRIQKQRGQAIILLAVMMIGMAGILGMTIDGGGLFFLHRDTQNAVDAALVASLYAKCTGNRSLLESTAASDPTRFANAYEESIHQAALRAAAINGFTDGVNAQVSISSNYQPAGSSKDSYIRVQIIAEKPSFFIQLVYPEPLTVTTAGVGYCDPSDANIIPNSAIVAVRGDTDGCNMGGGNQGNGKYSFALTGNSELEVRLSGIFVNSNDPNCAVLTNNNTTLDVDGACSVVGGIQAGGTMNCDGGITTPRPQRITQIHFLRDMDPPECTRNGTQNFTTRRVTPGRFTGTLSLSGEWTLEPGIYCVDGIEYSHNQSSIVQGDGVVIYMPAGNSGIRANAQARARLTAPTAANCGSSPDGETCAWQGLLIWSDVHANFGLGNRGTNGPIHINGGGGGDPWRGLVYAPGTDCTLEGMGHGTWLNIIGQLVCWNLGNAGNSNMRVTYELAPFLIRPPRVSITE